MIERLKSKSQWMFLLTSFLLFGCSEVMLIGAYNENVDQSIQSISKDISTLFVGLEKNINDNKDYSYNAFRDSYIKIEGEIASCETIASGIPKYNIIIKQIDLLDSSVKLLEQDHKTGFVKGTNANPDEIIKSVELDRSGINSSLESMLSLQEGLKRQKADKTKK